MENEMEKLESELRKYEKYLDYIMIAFAVIFIILSMVLIFSVRAEGLERLPLVWSILMIVGYGLYRDDLEGFAMPLIGISSTVGIGGGIAIAYENGVFCLITSIWFFSVTYPLLAYGIYLLCFRNKKIALENRLREMKNRLREMKKLKKIEDEIKKWKEQGHDVKELEDKLLDSVGKRGVSVSKYEKWMGDV